MKSKRLRYLVEGWYAKLRDITPESAKSELIHNKKLYNDLKEKFLATDECPELFKIVGRNH